MLQLLWNMFKETGQINAYIFFKALEQEGMMEEGGTDAPDGSAVNTAVGQYSPLEDHA